MLKISGFYLYSIRSYSALKWLKNHVRYIFYFTCAKKSDKSEGVRWGTFSKSVDFIWNEPLVIRAC